MDSEDDSLSDETRQRVEELTDDFVKKLRRGEGKSKQQLIDDYPDLAPYLENRLDLLEAVYRVTLQHSSVVPEALVAEDETALPKGTSSISGQDSLSATSFQIGKMPHSLRVRCPHCGNAVQLATKYSAQATCGSCGSLVHIDQDLTRTNDFDSIPKKIGQFQVIRLLGKGAFGLVYLANDPKLERQVAIKLPRKGFFVSAEEEQRFYREASSAAQLRHPNIVQVHEISQVDGLPFIVSEFIDGLTLNDLVSAGLLSFKEIANLMIQIANAVHHAHENGVIHRDLKPSNILIDRHQNAFVADFGLARRDDAEITVTLDGTILGTPAYMSPEQATGNHTLVDARSDVYSLGVILYRMLCQELPFNGTKRMLLHQVVHDEPCNPSKFNDRIPKDLDTITLKAMQKSTIERYQSAKQISEELQRWLRGEPIRARPIGSFVKLGRWCRRYPTVASLTGTIFGLLLLFSIGGLVTAKVQHELRVQSDANAKRASENELKSNSRLHQILEQNSLIALKDNRLIESAYWQAKANEIDDSVYKRKQLNMILDRLPKQTNTWKFEGKPHGIRFSNDGLHLATYTENGFVQVLDRASGRKICRLPANLSYSPRFQFVKSNIIAMRSANTQIQIWDTENTSMIKQIEFQGLISSLDVNQDSTMIAIGTYDSELIVVDALGKEKNRWPEGDWQILDTQFKRTNELLVHVSKAGETRHSIFVWNWVDNTNRIQIESESPIVDYDLSPNESIFVTADNQGRIQIWELEKGQKMREPIPLFNVARSVHFLDETTLVTIDSIGRVDRWDIKSENQNHLFGFGNEPDAISFSEERELIAAAESNGVVRVVWRENGHEICSAFSGTAKNPSMMFSPNGRELAIEGHGNSISIWDLAGSTPTQTIFEHKDSVRSCIFSPDGKRCVSAGEDGKILLIDAHTSKVINAWKHEGGILDCEGSPDGLFFATAGINSTAKVWDFFSGQQIGETLRHESPVMTLTFSPDSTKLATGCSDGTVREWPVRTSSGEQVFNFELKHENRIRRVVYSASGKYLLSGNLGGTAKCTDVSTGLPAFAPCDALRPLWDCAILPNEEQIVVSGSDGKVLIWNLTRAAVVEELNCNGDVFRMSITDDGSIITNDSSGVTKLWTRDANYYVSSSFDTPSISSVYETSRDAAEELFVTAGGKIGSKKKFPNSGAVAFWESTTGRQIAPILYHDGPVRRVAMDPSGTKLLTSSSDNTSRLIDLTPFKLLTRDAVLILESNTQLWTEPTQTSVYDKLRSRLPEFFQCSSTEIADWKKQIERWQNANQHEID